MMRWWRLAFWGLVVSASAVSRGSAQDTATIGTHDAASEPLICVVVRTYWKHGLGGTSLLQRLIDSLKMQTHARWEAQFLVMDSVPFYNLTDILQHNKDDRLWVYGNLVGDAWRSKTKEGAWELEYHTLLYHMTDQAARACSLDTQWVLFTNGDNLYHRDAFAEVAAEKTADAVAMDFYSRYLRPTGLPCERFQEDGAPQCKVNRMRWCHTDLGAIAYRWSKLVMHDYRFAMMEGEKRFTGQDALMAEAITNAGWNVTHLEGKCLFDQGPNPAMCARMGGIWDDRHSATTADFGGHCVLNADIEQFKNDTAVEVVQITFSNDGNLGGLALDSDFEPRATSLHCLRPSTNFRHMLVGAFGESCLEDIDRPLFMEYEALKAQNKNMPKSRKNPASSSWKRSQTDEPHDEL
eukprot:jgi/Ulvmu1/1499/UM011_0229.1